MSSRPLPQRRHAQRHHGQAEVQVLAEPPGRDLRLQVAVGGGQHADVDVDRVLLEPTRSKVFSWSTRSSLACKRQVDLGDFVQEDRAAVGHLEAADRAGRRPR